MTSVGRWPTLLEDGTVIASRRQPLFDLGGWPTWIGTSRREVLGFRWCAVWLDSPGDSAAPLKVRSQDCGLAEVRRIVAWLRCRGFDAQPATASAYVLELPEIVVSVDERFLDNLADLMTAYRIDAAEVAA